MSAIHLSDAQLDALADRMVDRLAQRLSAAQSPELLNAAEVAERLGRPRDWVYSNSTQLVVLC
jgi:hypothetical protein